jgi:hypothetical protein
VSSTFVDLLATPGAKKRSTTGIELGPVLTRILDFVFLACPLRAIGGTLIGVNQIRIIDNSEVKVRILAGYQTDDFIHPIWLEWPQIPSVVEDLLADVIRHIKWCMNEVNPATTVDAIWIEVSNLSNMRRGYMDPAERQRGWVADSENAATVIQL